ncbi:ABC transporter ATP-binding protein [Paenibacillus terrigena]|uniref:ABC transporter ATP-binding protein n=1 Tax=Paenibacillus terrigena TaxID=369333 RepID=UPI0003788362|nr:ABC transporter ATP-binding protein [Paenibacillus terrigena]
MTRQQVLIECDHVTYTYEGEERPAVRNVSLTIRQGEFVTIYGPNGSGKSTLCQMMNGLIPGQMGGQMQGKMTVQEYELQGHAEEVHQLSPQIGFVFQDPDAQLVVGSVEDELAFAPENLRIERAEIIRRLEETLRQVAMEDYRDRHVHQLSGGQKQRIAIAAVLTMKTPILILDDVTSSLDAAGKQSIFKLLHALHEQGVTCIATASRFDAIPRGTTRLITMKSGEIQSDESITNVKQLPVFLSSLESVKTAESKRHIAVEPIIEVRELTYRYPNGHVGLKPCSFNLFPGEIAALTGPNGCGKSTLTKLLMGLLPAAKGTIRMQGKDISKSSIYDRAKWLSYVHQQPEHQFIANTVMEECMYSLRMMRERRLDQTSNQSLMEEQGKQMLDRIGLYEKRDRHPFQLSQGEKRLLSVASMWLTDPKLLILDEPTSGQDLANTQRMFELCTDMAEHGVSILVVTHDQRWIESWVTRTMQLDSLAVKSEKYRDSLTNK